MTISDLGRINSYLSSDRRHYQTALVTDVAASAGPKTYDEVKAIIAKRVKQLLAKAETIKSYPIIPVDFFLQMTQVVMSLTCIKDTAGKKKNSVQETNIQNLALIMAHFKEALSALGKARGAVQTDLRTSEDVHKTQQGAIDKLNKDLNRPLLQPHALRS